MALAPGRATPLQTVAYPFADGDVQEELNQEVHASIVADRSHCYRQIQAHELVTRPASSRLRWPDVTCQPPAFRPPRRPRCGHLLPRGRPGPRPHRRGGRLRGRRRLRSLAYARGHRGVDPVAWAGGLAERGYVRGRADVRGSSQARLKRGPRGCLTTLASHISSATSQDGKPSQFGPQPTDADRRFHLRSMSHMNAASGG